MPTETFIDSAGATVASPFLARERRMDDAKRRHAETEARRSSGVCLSGLGPEAYRERDEAALREAAEAARDRAAAFANSPRGRFLAALNELDALSYADEAERARAAYRRGFADTRLPANPAEIGVALLALNPIAGKDARTARECLAEILLQTNTRKAA